MRLHPYYTERIPGLPGGAGSDRRHGRAGTASDRWHGYRLAGGHAPGGPAAGRGRRLLRAHRATTASRSGASDGRGGDPGRRVARRPPRRRRRARGAGGGRASSHAPARRGSTFTERELAVLRLIARGLATKEMAQRLGIRRRRPDTYIQHIYEKIGASRPAPLFFAVEHDLQTDPGSAPLRRRVVRRGRDACRRRPSPIPPKRRSAWRPRTWSRVDMSGPAIGRAARWPWQPRRGGR